MLLGTLLRVIVPREDGKSHARIEVSQRFVPPDVCEGSGMDGARRLSLTSRRALKGHHGLALWRTLASGSVGHDGALDGNAVRRVFGLAH